MAPNARLEAFLRRPVVGVRGVGGAGLIIALEFIFGLHIYTRVADFYVSPFLFCSLSHLSYYSLV